MVERDMASRLEHLNITVADPAATAAILGRIFGWRVRWQGASIFGGHTVHLGGDDTYLAIYGGSEVAKGRADTSYGTRGGLNHIGVVVDDLDGCEARVIAAGYVTGSHADYEPGRRFYFREDNGIEIEVVSYSGKGASAA
jgi:catechol 2,3-dioxygenase-like lactoylglutathione lyase family enzyme